MEMVPQKIISKWKSFTYKVTFLKGKPFRGRKQLVSGIGNHFLDPYFSCTKVVLATHFCDVTFFYFWKVFKTCVIDHAIKNEFKNIFKHVREPMVSWRALPRAFSVFFEKKVKVKFWLSGTIRIVKILLSLFIMYPQSYQKSEYWFKLIFWFHDKKWK